MAALQSAQRNATAWGGGKEIRKNTVDAAVGALKQIESAIDTAPARNVVFLATLARALPSGAEDAAGVPVSWADLLRPPYGSKKDRAASLTAAIHRAFAPLAVAARKAVREPDSD